MPARADGLQIISDEKGYFSHSGRCLGTVDALALRSIVAGCFFLGKSGLDVSAKLAL